MNLTWLIWVPVAWPPGRKEKPGGGTRMEPAAPAQGPEGYQAGEAASVELSEPAQRQE
jgi:hypothetical protein